MFSSLTFCQIFLSVCINSLNCPIQFFWLFVDWRNFLDLTLTIQYDFRRLLLFLQRWWTVGCSKLSSFNFLDCITLFFYNLNSVWIYLRVERINFLHIFFDLFFIQSCIFSWLSFLLILNKLIDSSCILFINIFISHGLSHIISIFSFKLLSFFLLLFF